MSHADTWYYSADGQDRQGPITWVQVGAAYKSGVIGPDSLLWAPHLSGWTPARDLLSQYVAPPITPSVDVAPYQATEAKKEGKGKLIGIISVVAIVAIIAVSKMIGNDYGNEIKFSNGGQLFYKNSVEKADAERLAEYLKKSGWDTGNAKTVQLNKNGDTFEFRMVIKKGIDHDEQYLANAKVMAIELSQNVFNGSKAEIHMCDEKLETIRVVVP